MKKIILLILIILLLSACRGIEDKPQPKKQLYIYATENKISEGFWNKNLENYCELFDCEIEFKIFSDPIDLYSDLNSLDSLAVSPDIILGIDNIIAAKVLIDEITIPLNLSNENKLIEEIKVQDQCLVPFAYSPLSFFYNKEIISEVPKTFGEMQDGFWQNQIILPDVTTSTTGNLLLAWSVAAFGKNGYGHFWRSLKDNIYQITTSWDLAIDMFLADMAPIVISPASYLSHLNSLAGSDKFGSFIPAEGSFLYLEYGAVLVNCQEKELANNLVNYLISNEFQASVASERKLLPVTNQIKHKLIVPRYSTVFKLPYSNLEIVNKNSIWGKQWKKLLQ